MFDLLSGLEKMSGGHQNDYNSSSEHYQNLWQIIITILLIYNDLIHDPGGGENNGLTKGTRHSSSLKLSSELESFVFPPWSHIFSLR